jgi:endonuclease-3
VARADHRTVSARRTRDDRPKTRARAPGLAGKRREEILARLARTYPHATTALHHRNTFELLIAVILSAQCTDARVNLTTPALFEAFPTPQALAGAPGRTLERLIRSCGFFRMKAKNIKAASRVLVERFGGRVPRTMEELLELPGVGRKTANVILATAYQQGAIAVDTHVLRVANRLGLAHAKTPEKVEQQLLRVVPKPDWPHVSHWLIFHGRQVCHARNPACAGCVVMDLCPSAKRFLRLTSGKKKG